MTSPSSRLEVKSPSFSPSIAETAASDRALERALFANFAIHGAAMVAMALLLAPMLPGGGEPNAAARVAAIAAHPWKFRAGWLPWHLCAVVDVWFAVALVRARWIPKLPAIITLVLTLAAVVPDQYAQLVWITRGVSLAAGASTPEGLANYLAWEAPIFEMTASWAALLYTLSALGWTACFAQGGAWSRTLSYLSAVTWSVMLYVTGAFFLPLSLRPPAEVIAIGNAVGFSLMLVWIGLVTEHTLRRRRPFAPCGRDALFRHPRQSIVFRALDLVANSRFIAALTEPIPELAMVSDITDVVYVNYLVPAEKLEPLVPFGLQLQRLGPQKEYGLFTFLTYNHGHFGFRILGRWRRLLPSPVQTNWRIHVEDPRTGKKGIFFVTNAIASTLLGVAARMLTEGMPMHILHSAELRREPGGHISLRLDPGKGSAPDAQATFDPAKEPVLEGGWKACFGSFRDFLAYAVPQDRAMSSQPEKGTITRQEIDLGIPLDICEPLSGKVESRAAEAIAGNATPLCFRVPQVSFLFEVEEKDPLD